MTVPLYLIRLVLNRRVVLRVATGHRLGQAADDGALLHAGLSELFAKSSARAHVPLHVFTVDDVRSAATREPDALFVLAYAEADDAALESEMGQMRPEILRRCESRPMPEFTVGQALGFRTRVCPIVRTRKPGTRPLGVNRHGRVKHREIDAFIHATLIAPEGARVDREAVYVGWLGRELQRHGACSLTAAEVVEFRRERMRRGRASLERPNVVLEGSLSVMDPAAFRALLIRGVGRHRAFGFGMILLRPPGR